ncbi:hypothetical protein [Blastococcus deserti]|uniref:Uncharacterized protein n=1 Tax=Blastococcus deserti TaxID=2259033 RepID=A0ABW4XG94_9ACTN
MTYARVHLVAWAVWAGMLVVAAVRAGGYSRVVADSTGEYVAMGILFVSSFTLVASAVAAKPRVGRLRATFGPISAAAAMTGAMLPAALKSAARSWQHGPAPRGDSESE